MRAQFASRKSTAREKNGGKSPEVSAERVTSLQGSRIFSIASNANLQMNNKIDIDYEFSKNRLKCVIKS